MTITHRFPQLAVRCTWCHAPVGELCTNPATGYARRFATHDARRTTWVTKTATCPVCEAAPGSPCSAVQNAFRVPLTTPHPERITAADRAHTANHRTLPWPHQPAAPTATSPSAGPEPKPAATLLSTPTPTLPATPLSGATAPAPSAPADRPPTSH